MVLLARTMTIMLTISFPFAPLHFFLVRTAFEGTKRIDIALAGIFGTRVVKPITLGTIDTLAGILHFFLKKLQLVFILPCVSFRSL